MTSEALQRKRRPISPQKPRLRTCGNVENDSVPEKNRAGALVQRMKPLPSQEGAEAGISQSTITPMLTIRMMGLKQVKELGIKGGLDRWLASGAIDDNQSTDPGSDLHKQPRRGVRTSKCILKSEDDIPYVLYLRLLRRNRNALTIRGRSQAQDPRTQLMMTGMKERRGPDKEACWLCLWAKRQEKLHQAGRVDHLIDGVWRACLSAATFFDANGITRFLELSV